MTSAIRKIMLLNIISQNQIRKEKKKKTCINRCYCCSYRKRETAFFLNRRESSWSIFVFPVCKSLVCSEKIMEIFRKCLLESTTTQSDLIEIFSAIDRGNLFSKNYFLINFLLEIRSFRSYNIGRISCSY